MGDSTTVDDLLREIPQEERPPSGNGGSSRSASRSSGGPSITQIEKRLKELYALGAIPISLKCELCAMHYANNAEAAAQALINAAKTNPKIRRLLELMVSGSTMTEVFVTHGVLIVPMLLHHNMLTIPPVFAGLFGEKVQHVHDEQPVATTGSDVPPTTAAWVDGSTVMPEEPSAETRAEDGSTFSLE